MVLFYYFFAIFPATASWIQRPLRNLRAKITLRRAQSANIPYHTAIGPIWQTFTRKIHRATRMNHMVKVAVIMVNFTSPAARSPYAGIKEKAHSSGLATVMAATICRHKAALSGSIPASHSTGPVTANTSRQETRIPSIPMKVHFTT